MKFKNVPKYPEILLKNALFMFSESCYLKTEYKKKTGKKLNLKNPKTFNEWIQWYKINYRNPLITQAADKANVRKYVKEKLGSHVLPEIYGIYDKVIDIPFSEFPEKTVLKCTHGSGWNIFLAAPSEHIIKTTKNQLNQWLSANYYKYGLEWAYKDIKPQILAEKYMVDENGNVPTDYKFFCFHGEPEFIQVDYDRFINHSRKIYDINWNAMPFNILYNSPDYSQNPPELLERMINYARRLSEDFPFVRVDLYQFNMEVIFGELTFYPGNGMEPFFPGQWDKKVFDFFI